MAFDFLGNIESEEQFKEFVEFINIEITTLDKKIDTMLEERNRLSQLLSQFKYSDLKMRSRYPSSANVDDSYLLKPRPIGKGLGDPIDASTAILVDDLKKMFIENIKHRREKNEFKIKKIRYLMEKIDKDINYLREMQTEYLSHIDKIKSRFDDPSYGEVQRVAEVDSADVTPGVKLYPPGSGTQIINGETYYLTLNINQQRKSITFDTKAPPVKVGDKITLINGTNNGIKTVATIVNDKTIQIIEDLINEAPSTTKIKINN
jgi:hypothetical protein